MTRTCAAWTERHDFRALDHDRRFAAGYDRGDVNSPLDPIDHACAAWTRTMVSPMETTREPSSPLDT